MHNPTNHPWVRVVLLFGAAVAVCGSLGAIVYSLVH